MRELTGLFLGAGASYEAGMPLVWELTQELKNWLSPQKLREFNLGWRQQGGGYSDAIIEEFAALLQRPDLHYESLLGYLETQFRRYQPSRVSQQEYHGLYSWLVQMVYYMLYGRHANNIQFLNKHADLYAGIEALAEKNNPLWVFSLNHDLIIEALAARLKIPLHSGFSARTISLPCRDKTGKILGKLQAHTLSESELHSGKFYYPNPPERGIYLLKIHGALDVFVYNEGKDLLKIIPEEQTIEACIDAIRRVNEEIFYPVPESPNGRANVSNEIAYADESGEMQFLRRSLLAGAYKFDERHSQVLPHALLKQFASNINFVTRLVCIGYGFGDLHINTVIRQWLEFSNIRHLEIVNPGITAVPDFVLHLAPQVTLYSGGASEYFDSIASIERTRREKLERRLAAYTRKHGAQWVLDKMRAFHEKDLAAGTTKLLAAIKMRLLSKAERETIKKESNEITIDATDDILERLVDHLENSSSRPSDK